MVWISVDVDLDEVYNGLRKFDKQELAQLLFEDGILKDHENQSIRLLYNEKESFMEEQHKKNLNNLWNKYYVMSGDDLKLIEEIAKKY